MTPNTIIQGDALTVLRTLPDNPAYIKIAGQQENL
jgi:hypothetical protein